MTLPIDGYVIRHSRVVIRGGDTEGTGEVNGDLDPGDTGDLEPSENFVVLGGRARPRTPQ